EVQRRLADRLVDADTPREVNDRCDLAGRDDLGDELSIADVADDPLDRVGDPRPRRRRRQVVERGDAEAGGVRHAREVRADKTRGACNEDRHGAEGAPGGRGPCGPPPCCGGWSGGFTRFTISMNMIFWPMSSVCMSTPS